MSIAADVRGLVALGVEAADILERMRRRASRETLRAAIRRAQRGLGPTAAMPSPCSIAVVGATRHVATRVATDVRATLQAAAQARQLPTPLLHARLLTAIARDGLIDAVLDERKA